MNRKKVSTSLAAIAALAVFVAFGCVDPGQNSGTQVVMSGTMIKGSIIIGGVHFDDTSASISADESAATPADLGDGMSIKLKGTLDSDGRNGTAEIVEVENEVRGTVASIGADSFVVLGQTVYVDGSTVFVNVADLSGIVATVDKVEVHGLRDGAGNIRAARVEKLTAPGVVDEVRGVVTGKTGTTSGSFSINGGTVSYDYDGATVIDGGVGFANGDLVEVHLSGTHADRIELEKAEDAEFENAEGFEVEGFVSGFTSLSAPFSVGAQQVEVSGSTRYEGGSSADLSDNAKVEAEGSISGGTLFAEKISFKQTIRLEDNAGSNGSADLLGLTVLVTSLTEYSDLPSGTGSILSGDGLRVRGYLNLDGSTVTATRVIKLSNPVDADRKVLQGVVSSSTAPGSLVIAGITVTVAFGASAEDNDTPLSVNELFERIVVGRTVVKARGTFAAGSLSADELSIE